MGGCRLRGDGIKTNIVGGRVKRGENAFVMDGRGGAELVRLG